MVSWMGEGGGSGVGVGDVIHAELVFHVPFQPFERNLFGDFFLALCLTTVRAAKMAHQFPFLSATG
jgi:hypothetical protein